MKASRLPVIALIASSLAFASDHNWSTGKVLDTAGTRTVNQTGTTSISHTNANATAYTHATVSHDYFGRPTVDSDTEASGQSTTFGGSRAHYAVFQENQIVIQGDGYIYTVADLSLKPVGMPTHGMITRAIQNRRHGCRLVVGDSIPFDQQKDKLFVLDADGKECKLDIVRQERIVSTNPALPAGH